MHVEPHDVVWLTPFIADEQHINTLSIVLSAWKHPGEDSETRVSLSFEIYSGSADSRNSRIHCQGQATLIVASASGDMDAIEADLQTRAAAIRAQGQHYSAEQVYACFKHMGLDYGAGHQGIVALYRDEQEADRRQMRRQVSAELQLSNDTDALGLLLPPGMLDSALQAAVSIALDLDADAQQQTAQAPLLPFSMGQVRLFAPCDTHMFVWARAAESAIADAQPENQRDLLKLDIDLYNADGRVCVQIRDFVSRRLHLAHLQDNAQLVLAVPYWDSLP